MTVLFINELLHKQWYELFVKLGIQALAWVLVLTACLIDLKTGIKASRVKGIFKTNSFGLRQTMKKFKDYMDVLLMAFITDIFLSVFVILSDEFSFLKIFDLPLITIVIFVYTMATEFISVLENKRKAKGAQIYTPEAIDAINDIAKTIGVENIAKLAELVKEKASGKSDSKGEENDTTT